VTIIVQVSPFQLHVPAAIGAWFGAVSVTPRVTGGLTCRPPDWSVTTSVIGYVPPAA
jgi:hypothetical protein